MYQYTPTMACIVATMMVALIPQGVTAKCQISDFNKEKLLAALADSGGATENLKAIQKSPIDLSPESKGLLALAIQVSDRATAEGAMFAGYLFIYSQLENIKDQDLTAGFITGAAKSSLDATTKYADFLTVVATVIPQYANEVRSARDSIRRIQRQFACAAE